MNRRASLRLCVCAVAGAALLGSVHGASAAPVDDEVIVSAPEEDQQAQAAQQPQVNANADASAASDTAPQQIAGVSGRLAVNIASGSGNQQLNGAVLAIGDVALATASAQQIMLGTDARDRTTRIALTGDVFARTSGMAAINITAGIQNQAANLAALSIGHYEALSDQLLAQSRASTEPSGSTGGTGDRNDSIEISQTAFRDSSGLIQVNLIGGERNSSSNIFVLSVLGEDYP